MASNKPPAGTISSPIEILDETSDTVPVHTLIDKCSPERLADVVKKLCTEDAYIGLKLTRLLTGNQQAEMTRVAEPESAQKATSSKRKALDDFFKNREKKKSKSHKRDKASSSHAICKNCNELFKHTDNEEGDCVYHDGMSYPNRLLSSSRQIFLVDSYNATSQDI
jgi:hypothetical protein